MRQLSLRQIVVIGLALLSVGVALVLLLGRGRAQATGSDSSLALLPSNFGALHSPATAVQGIPANAHIGAPYEPTPGSVHALGRGKAFAWVVAGQVCWAKGTASTCEVPSLTAPQAFEPATGDEDAVGRGKPAQVFGPAVDRVVEVAAILVNGERFSSKPINNWYEIDLPVSAAPWDVSRVQARLDNGQVVGYSLSTKPPPGQ